MSAAQSTAYFPFVAGRTRGVARAQPHFALVCAVHALWTVAPLAVGAGVVATRLVQSVDKFAVALGTTVAFGLVGGIVSVAIQHRRFVAISPAERHARGHGSDAL